MKAGQALSTSPSIPRASGPRGSGQAHLAEVFSGIQGEGIYVGERQIFIRFLVCNLSCQYCDTPGNYPEERPCRVEETPGKRNFKKNNNPVSLSDLLKFVDQLHKPKNLHHSVSLTGGEPLMQVDFLKDLIPEITKRDLFTYLETNGTLANYLKEIIDLVDIIAMDIKLPSATGLSSYFKEHRQCLEIASNKDLMVKVVFTSESTAKEIDEAAKLVEAVNPKIPFILQPVTPYGPIKKRPGAEETLAFQAVAKRRLENVRVIPQTHKIIGQM